MPSSPNYKTIIRSCKVCGETLNLNNSRDVSRKKFCSHACKGSFISRIRIERGYGERECLTCGESFKAIAASQKYCSSLCSGTAAHIRNYGRMDGNIENYISHLLSKKERAQISLEYILDLYNEQAGLCAISGIEMTCIKIPNTPKVHTNLSIDRIDSSKGYEIGNIQLVCAIVNIMKSSLTMEELQWWASKINSTLGG